MLDIEKAKADATHCCANRRDEIIAEALAEIVALRKVVIAVESMGGLHELYCQIHMNAPWPYNQCSCDIERVAQALAELNKEKHDDEKANN